MLQRSRLGPYQNDRSVSVFEFWQWINSLDRLALHYRSSVQQYNFLIQLFFFLCYWKESKFVLTLLTVERFAVGITEQKLKSSKLCDHPKIIDSCEGKSDHRRWGSSVFPACWWDCRCLTNLKGIQWKRPDKIPNSVTSSRKGTLTSLMMALCYTWSCKRLPLLASCLCCQLTCSVQSSFWE